MHSTSETVVLRHREYIGDVNSSLGFVNKEYPINPGLSSTFPFLSSIAANFQEYNFKGLVFEFRSTSADALNSTNTALGTVAMVVQYRAGATSLTSKQQVLNEMWSADSKPSESFFMPVECAPAECPMDIQYVRSGSLSSADDIKFYDLGKLCVATNGSQAVAVVGELWASYEVVLRKPILGGAIGSDDNSFTMTRVLCTSEQPLGTVILSTGSNSLGVSPSSSALTLPSGSQSKYLVTATWLGPANSAFANPNLSMSNLTSVEVGGSIYNSSGSGTASNGCTVTIIVYLANPSAPGTISFIGGTLATPCSVFLNIASVDFDTIPT